MKFMTLFYVLFILGIPDFLLHYSKLTLREKCSNTEFFLVRIFLYSGQKNFLIWTLFTQCRLH